MSHYRAALEIVRCLDFSPDVKAIEREPNEAIGESYFRVTGPDGMVYGVVVCRIDQPLDVTGEIVIEDRLRNSTP